MTVFPRRRAAFKVRGDATPADSIVTYGSYVSWRLLFGTENNNCVDTYNLIKRYHVIYSVFYAYGTWAVWIPYTLDSIVSNGYRETEEEQTHRKKEEGKKRNRRKHGKTRQQKKKWKHIHFVTLKTNNNIIWYTINNTYDFDYVVADMNQLSLKLGVLFALIISQTFVSYRQTWVEQKHQEINTFPSVHSVQGEYCFGVLNTIAIKPSRVISLHLI